MEESQFIEKEASNLTGMDFYALRKEGIGLLQEFSNTIWTDYNEHDPGVTILEQLCYALTSLSYSCETPLRDLLIEKKTGRIDSNKQALFIPEVIYPCNPWTENDYRKLVLDRIHAIGNIWFVPREIEENLKSVAGLYDVLVYAPQQSDEDRIKLEVKSIYAAHRNLCEDLHKIQFLKPRKIQFFADVTFNGSSPDLLLAQIYFAVGQYLSPEVKRFSLEQMIDSGFIPDEIFEGPLMKNGFIRIEDLQPIRKQLLVSQIKKIILGLSGTNNLNRAFFRVGEQDHPESLPVPDHIIYVLDAAPSKQDTFTIRLFRNGIEYKPDVTKVKRELQRLQQEFRYRYRLEEQYDKYFGVPTGTYKPVQQYYSIQNQFPDVFGIGSFGLPKSDSPGRLGEAKQLKGYLLLFEQLMADFLEQLSHTKNLFSIDPAVKHTYYYQSLEGTVPHVKDLLKKERGDGEEDSLFEHYSCLGYKRGLKRLINSLDPFIDRRNRFLDFLMALYAEKLSALSTFDFARGYISNDYSLATIHTKLELLKYVPVTSRDRGKGFDYLKDSIHDNWSGIELKLRILLGMAPYPHLPFLKDEFNSEGISIAKSEEPVSGKVIIRTEELPIELYTLTELMDETEQNMTKAERASLLKPILDGKNAWVDVDMLYSGGSPSHYRLAHREPGNTVDVLIRHAPTDGWQLLGTWDNQKTAVSAALEWMGTIGRLRHHCNRLYIIEHNLLRYSGYGGDGFGLISNCDHDDGQEGFGYNFRITAVFSGCHDIIHNADYRKLAEERMAECTPAHIVADCIWLNPWEMIVFEVLYELWRIALRLGDSGNESLGSASNEISKFLNTKREKPLDSQK